MTRTLIALLLALAVPFTTAYARDGDRRELRKDRREMRDDLRDARKAEALLRDFERTWANMDRAAVRAVERRAQAAMDDEVREAFGESRDAVRELHRDRREDPGDRRERADDRRDLMQAREYLDRVRTIRDEWTSLRNVTTWQAMSRKHALLEELVRLSRLEIRQNMDEIREDRRP
jgi:hypothetical protein